MNWYILIPFGIAIVVLIILLIVKNQKDEVKFEDQVNNDYRKTKEEEGDVEIDEKMK
jgi:low affinity Fe/Cu permease